MDREQFVSSAEFTRWITEEGNFRTRLEKRLEVQATHVNAELAEIKGMVREANGRTNKNGEAIAVLQREFEAIKSEDSEIQDLVRSIKENGCSQLSNHQTVLATLGWTPQKKAVVAGTLVGTGALVWPALQKIAEAFIAWHQRHP